MDALILVALMLAVWKLVSWWDDKTRRPNLRRESYFYERE